MGSADVCLHEAYKLLRCLGGWREGPGKPASMFGKREGISLCTETGISHLEVLPTLLSVSEKAKSSEVTIASLFYF